MVDNDLKALMSADAADRSVAMQVLRLREEFSRQMRLAVEFNEMGEFESAAISRRHADRLARDILVIRQEAPYSFQRTVSLPEAPKQEGKLP